MKKSHNSTKGNDLEPADSKSSENDLESMQAQIESLNAQLLRERADAMNVRRRADEERIKLGSYYKAMVVREFLPFLDNLDRALKHAPDATQNPVVKVNPEWESWYSGIQSVTKQLSDALDKLGVERIKTVGELFNPELHEAVVMEEGDGEQEIVSEELQSGYKIGDEVIRHAMVRVKLS